MGWHYEAKVSLESQKSINHGSSEKIRTVLVYLLLFFSMKCMELEIEAVHVEKLSTVHENFNERSESILNGTVQ